MKLKDIYARNIDRQINPAVVVRDDKEETVNAEIEEYVFTDEIVKNLYRMLDAVLNKKSGKTGIWINGYYGSGKSHFIKYNHYLLDPKTSERAFGRLEQAVSGYDTMKPGADIDITPGNLKMLQKKAGGSSVDNVMFNVEDVSGDEADAEKLTHVMLRMFNRFRGFNESNISLALLLEKPLKNRGELEEFKAKIQSEMGHDWDRDASMLAGFSLEQVLAVAKKCLPELDPVALHASISEGMHISVNTLIDELKDHIQGQENNYRLVFLVDEISQYIRSNGDILLNFQSIVERVSLDCNSQVWIACTAQQRLEDVSAGIDGVVDAKDEFGKILGRFDTRINLQSTDASYITQKRVLDKNSTGIGKLNEIYQDNKDYIENQFKINHDLYKGYSDQDDFVTAYPFVPYQFKLIAHVFEAFQQLNFVIREVKDNERSVLGITHFTAKKTKDHEVGGFIPFDEFYNQQFHTNLTHRGMRAIQNALDLSYVKENPFAERVVKVLFMVSYLLESQKQTFPSNIDNLTILLMDRLDQNKKQLQNQVKEVLDRLIDESIIREEKGSYFFFNEDEMDVQNMIKNQEVSLDDRFKRFDEDFFRQMVDLKPKVTFESNDFRMKYQLENKDLFTRGDFTLKVLLTDNSQAEQFALGASRNDLVVCVNEWFNKDEDLRKDFMWYCKTTNYLNTNSSGLTGERANTIENFKIRRRELGERLMRRFRDRFAETRFISQQRTIESDEIPGSNPKDRMANALQRHLSGIYKNQKQSAAYAQNSADLKKSAASRQTMLPELSPAEKLVNDFITQRGNQVTVEELIRQFEAEPFGWRPEALLDVLVHLVKKKKREFKYRGAPRYPIVEFVTKALSTPERPACEVVTGEEIDQAMLDEAASAFKTAFNVSLVPSTDGNEQFDQMTGQLNKQLEVLSGLESKHAKYPWSNTVSAFKRRVQELSQKQSPKQLFQFIMDTKDTLKQENDHVKSLEDFVVRNADAYQGLQEFIRLSPWNGMALAETDASKVQSIRDFLESDAPMSDLRHAMKAKEELGAFIAQETERRRKQVTEAYGGAVSGIHKEAVNRGVDQSICTPFEEVQSWITNAASINELQSLELELPRFRTEEMNRIIKAASEGDDDKGGLPETAIFTPASHAHVIKNEAEMNAYLDNLREQMTKHLKAGKTIILK